MGRTLLLFAHLFIVRSFTLYSDQTRLSLSSSPRCCSCLSRVRSSSSWAAWSQDAEQSARAADQGSPLLVEPAQERLAYCLQLRKPAFTHDGPSSTTSTILGSMSSSSSLAGFAQSEHRFLLSSLSPHRHHHRIILSAPTSAPPSILPVALLLTIS